MYTRVYQCPKDGTGFLRGRGLLQAAILLNVVAFCYKHIDRFCWLTSLAFVRPISRRQVLVRFLHIFNKNTTQSKQNNEKKIL